MNFLSSTCDITSFWRDTLYTYIYICILKKIRVFMFLNITGLHVWIGMCNFKCHNATVTKCALCWFHHSKQYVLHFFRKDSNVSKMNDNSCLGMAQQREGIKEFERATQFSWKVSCYWLTASFLHNVKINLRNCYEKTQQKRI